MRNRRLEAEYVELKKIVNGGRYTIIDIHNNDIKATEDFIFFTIKNINDKNIYGYLKVTPYLNDIRKKRLCSDRKWNDHVEFIEWDDCYLVAITDGLNISTAYRKVTKKELKNKFNIKRGGWS